MDVKTCTKCGETKPVSEFYMTRGKPTSPCKACVLTRQRAGTLALYSTEGSKVCTQCGDEKPLTGFYRNQGRPSSRCKACRSLVGHEQQLAKHVARGTRMRGIYGDTHLCPQCHIEKPLSAFFARKRGGISTPCKACCTVNSREHYRANPKKHAAYMRVYREKHPERFTQVARRSALKYRHANLEKARASGRAVAARRKAQKLGTVIEPITSDTILMIIERDNYTCYLCGRKLDPATPGRNPAAIEIDHVVPLARGGTHTVANLRAACKSCNARKHDKLLEELDWYTPLAPAS